MGFLSLSLPVVNRSGIVRTLTWQHDGQSPCSDDGLLKASIPVRDRRTGPSLDLRIEICGSGSLESAGRRVALFTRLIDEHSVVSLPAEK